ncbi:hypothetical protein [Pseudomonas serbica]|jgi:hypothetical protein|uniref:hypothetical protein n=1 Tax=Pseudomonas serbica TaxID=2965074 RepID=UPI00237B606F|nr:hypothetical protein [Pseudomonas serbica]
MSRSRRKTPIIGHTTAVSESFDKAKWHRAFRRAENKRLSCDPESESHHLKEFFNPYSMHKDGKQWIGIPCRHPEEMRK